MQNLYTYAKPVLEYLSLRDMLPPKADIIVGFGHFDMRIAQQCGSLYTQGLADKILFTGGRGAGTADIAGAEGDAFNEELRKTFPAIPAHDVIVENRSTNTGENILYSEEVLRSVNPEFTFSSGIRRVIAVACPYRQRRVYLTFKKLFPLLEIVNCPYGTTLEREIELYRSKEQDFVALLTGELQRIATYPDKGFIAHEHIPEHIKHAYEHLAKQNT